MSVITLRIPEELVTQIDQFADRAGLSRAEYVRNAIIHYIKEAQKVEKVKRLTQASLKVRKQNTEINHELRAIEDILNDA